MNAQTIASQVSKFNTLQSAKSFAARAKKSQLIVMGCDGLYWVASMSFGAKLEKSGYELIKQ